MPDDLFAGLPVDLDSLLGARDRRAERRIELFREWPRPLVSVTPVIPGPVKSCRAAQALVDGAGDALVRLARERGWAAELVDRQAGPAGPEAALSVAADAIALKRAVVGLEESHPLGRLWDLDVIDPAAGPISRRALGLPPRTCFVCAAPAHVCARSRAHPLDDLLQTIRVRLDAHLLSHPA